ncbi:hypothetical protein NMY3_02848 [Candidatus Nitrosocosmicus oleophilus]|jgi:hypothetical protein|uniref:Uncharacterized protein n=1 Tax=Candidatus Nitrosocosmicus oleophilus TaxID=1353260 RepID=A0A654M1I4_9ARCH|nr:hypothetical protein NMY3_02848 [Candidatus Nitrosocosmicus oleophilus]
MKYIDYNLLKSSVSRYASRNNVKSFFKLQFQIENCYEYPSMILIKIGAS